MNDLTFELELNTKLVAKAMREQPKAIAQVCDEIENYKLGFTSKWGFMVRVESILRSIVPDDAVYPETEVWL
jgi:hypothetical protein